jgi:hypothetical protein
MLASWRSRTKKAGPGAGNGSIVPRRGSGTVPKCHVSKTLFNTVHCNCFVLSLGVDLMAGRLKRGAAWSPPHPHHTSTLSKISGLLVDCYPHLHTVKDLRCVGYCYPHLHTVKDLRFVGFCYLTYTLSKISGVLVSVTTPTHCQRSQVCWLPQLHTVKDIRCFGYCYLTYTLSKISGVLVTVTTPTHCQRSQVCWLTVTKLLHIQNDVFCFLVSKNVNVFLFF